MRISLIAGAAALMALGGCATIEHGTVAEAYPTGLARIYLGSADGLQTGSAVNFYEEKCLDEMEGSYPYRGELCDSFKLGGGTVTQVLSEHEALVNLDPGVSIHGDAFVKANRDDARRMAH